MPTAELEIPKHYVPSFGRNVMWTPQQNRSKLKMFVTNEKAEGEGAAPWDIWGETQAEEANDRYGDTPIMEVDRDRPWVFPKGYHWGTMVDTLDKLKAVLDPTSNMLQAARKALDRTMDRNIIMPAFFGPRYVGKDVATAIAAGPQVFNDTLYKISNVVGSTGGATPVGMNVAKLQAVKAKFMSLEVDVDRERINLAMTSQQWANLFDDAKAINGDFVNGRPISSGSFGDLMGFNFIFVEQLPWDGVDDRWCPAWVESGMGLLEWQGQVTEMAKDPGKQYRVRPYVKFFAGATRTVEGLVLKVECREV